MTKSRQRLGRAAEELAARRLERSGALVIARNVHLSRGELDIVAVERGVLAFIEVKARRAGSLLGPERAVLAVDRGKQRRLRALAAEWLALNRGALPRHRALRFDVIGVEVGRDGRVSAVEHLRNAF